MVRFPAAFYALGMFITLTVACPPSAFGQAVHGRDVPSRPNILIILADDLGYGDVKCYNPERGKIPTPHLDRLAAEGMRFTDAHSSSAVCSPTRYSLLTGRYHWRTWLQHGIVNRFGPPLIAPERMTVADLLKRNGYRTACIGKWHLGWNWPIPLNDRDLFLKPPRAEGITEPLGPQRELWQQVFSQPMSGGPIDCGFDSFFGVDLPNFPPFCFIENDRTVGIPSEFLAPELLVTNQASMPGPALANWRLKPILPTITDRACEFIEDAKGHPEPFFLYLPLTSPHTPLAVNDEWHGKSGLNDYADLVMETDAAVGRVLETLERSGLADETLVIFTSDNGCAYYIGTDELERKGHFASGPLRGYKSDAWEGGHRVPFVVRWPGVVAAESRSDELAQQVDLMATFAELLDEELPPTAGEDSVSLLPLLRGGKQPVRETAINQSIRGLLALRKGPWKLIFGPDSGGWTEGSDNQPAQLYHLGDDLAESNNLYAQRPEVVADQLAIMEEQIARGRSTRGPDQANDVPVQWRRFLAPAAGR